MKFDWQSSQRMTKQTETASDIQNRPTQMVNFGIYLTPGEALHREKRPPNFRRGQTLTSTSLIKRYRWGEKCFHLNTDIMYYSLQ